MIESESLLVNLQQEYYKYYILHVLVLFILIQLIYYISGSRDQTFSSSTVRSTLVRSIS
jgi:hypothetical protein